MIEKENGMIEIKIGIRGTKKGSMIDMCPPWLSEEQGVKSRGSKKFKAKDVLARILMRVEGMNKMVRELNGEISQINQIVVSHSTSIKQLETQISQISTELNARPKGGLPSDTVVNPKKWCSVLEIITCSGKELGALEVEVKEKSHSDLVNTKNKHMSDSMMRLQSLKKGMKKSQW